MCDVIFLCLWMTRFLQVSISSVRIPCIRLFLYIYLVRYLRRVNATIWKRADLTHSYYYMQLTSPKQGDILKFQSSMYFSNSTFPRSNEWESRQRENTAKHKSCQNVSSHGLCMSQTQTGGSQHYKISYPPNPLKIHWPVWVSSYRTGSPTVYFEIRSCSGAEFESSSSTLKQFFSPTALGLICTREVAVQRKRQRLLDPRHFLQQLKQRKSCE